MKTSKNKLDTLREEKEAAISAYNKYLKEYNEENEIEPGALVDEIIKLHKKGLMNKEIIEQGYNKNYVNKMVGLFKKGQRIERTTVAGFLPKKLKKG